MKSFVKKIFVFTLIILVVYILLGFFADGYTDPFYKRFTGTKETSMILGTSRAAQGILPQEFMKFLKPNTIKKPIYNYSFTVLHSPFGELYDKMIKEKLSRESKNGLFIVAVSPWALSHQKESDKLIEDKTNFGKLKYFNHNPNYDYLANVYKGSMFNLVWQQIDRDTSMFLHSNGWLEVSLNMDSKVNAKRTKGKINSYKKKLETYEISFYRLNWLEKTVNYLKEYGQVILVRIPMSEEMLSIENELVEDFNKLIQTRFPNTYYLDYSKNLSNYEFIDGTHLYTKSAAEFTRQLALDINKILEND